MKNSKEPESTNYEAIIKDWISVEYDKIRIVKINYDRYRVTLYKVTEGLIHTFKITNSYFLKVEDNIVEDLTR